MASDSQQKQFLMQFHQLLFNDKLETGTPSEKADILRSIILLLECAHPLKILPFDSPHPLLAKYEEMYARVRDAPASSAESCRWKSSLTLEGVKSMDFMKEFYEEAERRAKQVEASHFKDRPIFKNVQLANQDLPGKGEKIDMHDQNMGPDDFVHYIKGPAAAPPPVQSPLVFGGAPTLAGFSQAHSGVQQGSGSSASESYFSSKWAQYTGNTPGERQPFSKKRGREDGDGSGAFGQRSLFSGPGHAAAKGGTCSGEPSPRYHGNQFPMEGDSEGTASGGGGRLPSCPFRTAAEQLQLMCAEKKFGHASDQAGQVSNASYGNFKKSLGTRRGGPSTRFIPPVMMRDEDSCRVATSNTCRQANKGPEELQDERLRGLDPKLVELIESDIMDIRTQISWKDIAGLKYAKDTMKEAVVLPLIRPDIFSGLRTPTKGLLLFGPPGTGKTLIGKCIASQSMATFFSISASSLTSKYVGEGEKMVKTLFAVARCKQPSVIFIDEIDSLLSHRSDSEHEASRRIKTEFFVQLDGAATVAEDRILVIGATNRPQELDEAAKRRFVKRLYIPLPETEARMQIIVNLMSTQKHCLSDADLLEIAQRTDGYSGADMANLCKEAAMGPIRSIPLDDIENIQVDQVRPIVFSDFQDALPQVRASVSEKDLNGYIEWNKIYGSCVN